MKETLHMFGGAMSLPRFFIVATFCVAAILPGCGGGSGSTGSVAPSIAPVVSLPSDASSVALDTAGSSTFTVSEPGYSGAFSATSSNLAVATVTQVASASAALAIATRRRDATSASFTITGVGAGTATITIADQGGHSSSIPVTVSATIAKSHGGPSPVASPSALSFSETGQQQSVAVAEAGYSGSFAATSSDSAVASVSPASDSNSFTVSAGATAGSATITFVDTNGNATAVSVGVTLYNGVISTTHRSARGARR